MAEMARWGNKVWEINETSLTALENLEFNYTQVADNNRSTEEKQITNQRGKELFPLKFATTLIPTANLDVRKEIEEWESLVTKVDYFFLGGRRLGPAVQLRKVSVSDVKLDNCGNILHAKLAFEFKEYDQETSSVKTDVPALSVTASSESKELKKLGSAVKISKVNGIKVGDYVKFSGNTWANGATIDDEWADRAHEVTGIQGNKYILGFPDGICAWAYAKDISLV